MVKPTDPLLLGPSSNWSLYTADALRDALTVAAKKNGKTRAKFAELLLVEGLNRHNAETMLEEMERKRRG